jgi:hypothetical protein
LESTFFGEPIFKTVVLHGDLHEFAVTCVVRALQALKWFFELRVQPPIAPGGGFQNKPEKTLPFVWRLYSE